MDACDDGMVGPVINTITITQLYHNHLIIPSVLPHAWPESYDHLLLSLSLSLYIYIRIILEEYS